MEVRVIGDGDLLKINEKIYFVNQITDASMECINVSDRSDLLVITHFKKNADGNGYSESFQREKKS